MPKYKMIAFTQPKQGCEAEFNDWYQNIHLPQVTALNGVVSGERYRLAMKLTPAAAMPYLAIYGVETDDLKAVAQDFMTKAGTADMVLPEALDLDKSQSAFYEPLGPVVRGKT